MSVEDKPLYEQRYVAFADILGFTAIVSSSARSTRQAKALADALLSAHDRSGSPYDDGTVEIKSQSFSDSIVLSSAPDLISLAHLLRRLTSIALMLMKQGILLRGGVSKGLLFHQGTVMFGPAFLDAYRIESTVAKFPRVIIGSPVFDDYRCLTTGDAEELGLPKILLDDDGPAYLDILHDLLAGLYLMPSTDPRIEDARTSQRAIQSLVNAAMHEPRHFEKVRWLSKKWNAKIGVASPVGLVSLPRQHWKSLAE